MFTALILVFATLIDSWLFDIFPNHKALIYFFGVVAFFSLIVAVITSIWYSSNNKQ